MARVERLLRPLIAECERLGVGTEAMVTLREFLEMNEFGLCLEHIVDLVWERDLVIDRAFYDQVQRAATEMSLSDPVYMSIARFIK